MKRRRGLTRSANSVSEQDYVLCCEWLGIFRLSGIPVWNYEISYFIVQGAIQRNSAQSCEFVAIVHVRRMVRGFATRPASEILKVGGESAAVVPW